MSTRFPTDAILLAAGLGTRLQPLTLTRPKPLVPVLGVFLLDRVISAFAAEGVTGFAINAHYHADQMQQAVSALPQRFPNCRFALSREDDGLLNTGGGAKKALGLIASDPVFVANTDAFWRAENDAPLARMSERLAARPDTIVLLCAHPARALGFRGSHDFCLDPRGTITLDTGLPVIYAGVALTARAAFATAPEGAFSMNLLFEEARAENRLQGILLNAPWYHVGDPEALSEAETVLAKV